MNKLVSRNVACLVSACLAVVSAHGQPSISAVEPIDRSEEEGTQLFRVTGSGFGDKQQGPPVLRDFGKYTFENGVRNDFQGNFFSNGQYMHDANDEPMRIWDGVGTPGGSIDRAPTAFIRDGDHRHENVGAHYRMRGGAFVGLPMAYGGNHSLDPSLRRFPRPDGNTQIYVSWWIKTEFDPYKHVEIQQTGISGNFDFGESERSRGERFVVPSGGAGGTDVDGWVIGINDDGWLEVEFDTMSNINMLAGKTLEGQATGAKAQISEDTGTIESFTSPEKYARIWETGGGSSGVRATWGLETIIVSSSTGPGDGGSVWFGADLEPQSWNLMEFMIDKSRGTAEYWVNFEKKGSFSFDPSVAEHPESSPTLQLLGQNSGDFGLNTFEISEPYMDSTWQRVIVADSKNLEEATTYELQRPLSWSENSIEFAFTQGQLPAVDNTYYVFIFDRNGSKNPEGYPLEVVSPPNPPSIESVE